MKICIVTPDLQRTIGQGRINYELADHLARRGHEIVLVSNTLTPPLEDAPNVVWRPVPIPGGPLARGLARYQAFALGARRVIRAEPGGFDIVHVNGFTTYFPADVNVSMFVHAHWVRSSFYRLHRTSFAYSLYYRFSGAVNARLEKVAYRAARRVVALSPMVRDSLITHVGVAPDRIAIIRPGVDADEFRPRRSGEADRLRAELSLPEETFLIFFVGEIWTRRKNLDLTLRALAQLDGECRLVVAGATEGSPYPDIAREMGIAERVHFLGHRTDVATLLRSADAFAFASHYDPYALVVTEAMASEVPVITAPSVGAAEAISNGKNGFVLRDSDDLAGMVAVLRRLKADPEFARRVGRAARATAERLSWSAMASAYESLYQTVVEEKRRTGVAVAEALAASGKRQR